MWSNGNMIEGGAHEQPEYVRIDRIPDGGRFLLPLIAFASPSSQEIVLTGWAEGVKLYHNACRARVRMRGEQRQVVFGDGERRREFDALGSMETNYPVSIDVVPVNDNADDAAQRETRRLRISENITMAANEKALRAKYQFQMKELAKAGEDEGKRETVQARIDGIIAEAEAAGVNLVEQATKPASTSIIPKGSDFIAGVDEEKTAKVPTQAEKNKAENAIAKAKLADEKAERMRVKAEEKAAREKAKADAKTEKEQERAEKMANATRDCVCGCGAETGGLFRPGHDARVKGILLQVERGVFPGGFDALPETLKPYVKFAGDPATATKDDGDYHIVQAPVKFPGRDDIAVVKTLDATA